MSLCVRERRRALSRTKPLRSRDGAGRVPRLVAGGARRVTKVSICLLPHFLFRPTGTGREVEGGTEEERGDN